MLLFLSGGPGGSELGRVRRFDQPLEERFVLVVWEQRGCGKSYDAINSTSALDVQQYVSDAIELSEMLRARFHEDKIYLLGHSWGTIMGVRRDPTLLRRSRRGSNCNLLKSVISLLRCLVTPEHAREAHPVAACATFVR